MSDEFPAGTPAAMAARVYEWSQRHPSDPALFFPEEWDWRWWSWSRWWRAIEEHAAAQRQCGARAGETVRVISIASPEYLAAVLALGLDHHPVRVEGAPERSGAEAGEPRWRLDEQARLVGLERGEESAGGSDPVDTAGGSSGGSTTAIAERLASWWQPIGADRSARSGWLAGSRREVVVEWAPLLGEARCRALGWAIDRQAAIVLAPDRASWADAVLFARTTRLWAEGEELQDLTRALERRRPRRRRRSVDRLKAVLAIGPVAAAAGAMLLELGVRLEQWPAPAEGPAGALIQ